MALDGLNIAVVADSAGVSLKAAITYDLATTAQTSACVSNRANLGAHGLVFYRKLNL
jgi:hypothetical protein